MGSNNWKQYDAQSAAALTAAAGAGTTAFTLTIAGNLYDINLGTMRQKKQASGFERQIRHGGRPSKDDYVEILVENDANHQSSDRVGTKGLVCRIVKDDGSDQPFLLRLLRGTVRLG